MEYAADIMLGRITEEKQVKTEYLSGRNGWQKPEAT